MVRQRLPDEAEGKNLDNGRGWKRTREKQKQSPALRLKPEYGMKKTLKKLGVLLVY